MTPEITDTKFPAEDLRAAAKALRDAAVWPVTEVEQLATKLESAAEFLNGAVGMPPSGYPLTSILNVARVINGTAE